MSEIISLDAPAKLNLALHVTGRRADGYHLIESLAVFTRFGDRMTVEPADADSFLVTGKYAADAPTDDTNLVIKAREKLRERFGRDLCGPVAITLEKNLPVASGVGGGSSDAAAALTGLARLWNLDVDRAALAGIGLTLGADVPMCLAARPLVARGIGDEIQMLAGFASLGFVLVNPGVAVSTADVFRELKNRENARLPGPPAPADFHSLRNWLGLTRNDLQQAAETLAPPIGAAIQALERAGSGFTRMSGSGATCFGLFETGNVAKRAAAQIRQRHPDWFVAATRSIPSEDFHGSQ